LAAGFLAAAFLGAAFLAAGFFAVAMMYSFIEDQLVKTLAALEPQAIQGVGPGSNTLNGECLPPTF
jgi:hypothetical protein